MQKIVRVIVMKKAVHSHWQLATSLPVGATANRLARMRCGTEINNWRGERAKT